MSGGDVPETTVVANGVHVWKRYEFDRFSVPAVTLELQSQRADEASVSLEDPLPASVDLTDVGLHQNQGKDVLSVAEGGVTLATDLDPDERFTAVYGLRNVSKADLPTPPTTPTLDVAPEHPNDGSPADTAPTAEDDTTAGNPDQFQADSERAENDAVPAEPNTHADRGATETVDQLWAEPEDEPRSGSDGDSVLARLAEELRSGTAADRDLTILRESLDAKTEGAMEARIADLQSEIADLRAYTNALEELLDNYESGERPLESLRRDLDEVRGSLSDVEREVASTQSDLDTLRSDLESLASTVDTLHETVINVEDGIAGTRKELRDLEARIDEDEST